MQHRLATGRHGVVWGGMRISDSRAVAVKTVQADRVADAARFLREAQALAGIDHPHIVRCLASGRTDGQLWLAMDLAAGDLAVEVRAGAAGATAVLEAGRDAARGLAELHRRGLVHRDITPANLLRMPDGRVVVGDFGLVRGDQERLTRTGEILGTPAYLAPEQAAGGAVDARADVYALGAVLYALATGGPPYPGDNAWGVLSRIAAGPFPDPRAAVPEILPQLRAIILAATGLRPDDRYQDAGELAEDCTAVLAGGTPRHAGAVRARRAPDPAPAPPARPRPLLAAGGAAAAGLVLGMVPGWLLMRPDAQERADYAATAAAGDAAAWRLYLQAHPAGPGAAAARRALAVLDAGPPPPTTDAGTQQGELAALQAEVDRLRRAAADAGQR